MQIFHCVKGIWNLKYFIWNIPIESFEYEQMFEVVKLDNGTIIKYREKMKQSIYYSVDIQNGLPVLS